MIRLILILGLVVFFVPSLAGADEDVECEIEVHDDGFTEVEYENDVTGAECTAVIAPASTPTAEAQACIELCETLLPEPVNMCTIAGVTGECSDTCPGEGGFFFPVSIAPECAGFIGCCVSSECSVLTFPHLGIEFGVDIGFCTESVAECESVSRFGFLPREAAGDCGPAPSVCCSASGSL